MVHQYKLNNYNIVLDTCSGAVHSVDPIAYDIIAMFQDKSEEEIVSEIMAKYGNLGNPAEVENPSEAEILRKSGWRAALRANRIQK